MPALSLTGAAAAIAGPAAAGSAAATGGADASAAADASPIRPDPPPRLSSLTGEDADPWAPRDGPCGARCEAALHKGSGAGTAAEGGALAVAVGVEAGRRRG